MTLVRPLQGRSEPVSGEAFRAAMRNLAGGVSIIASGRDEDRRGLTVTAVTAVTSTPPTLAVFVNQSAEAHDVIKATGAFCVSVLAAGHVPEATLFSGQNGLKGAIRFAPQDWDSLVTGSPALTSAVANIDCELIECIGLGSHTMFLGQVVATRCDDGAPPLVYLRAAYHTPDPLSRPTE
ncbi:flavin reductase family protein [Pararhodobacter sp.]|uniref:flavin reductase family protein n=1 Tax=Pararhodobacter sp. TaxID=2127056 RepID=UPI002FE13D2C